MGRLRQLPVALAALVGAVLVAKTAQAAVQGSYTETNFHIGDKIGSCALVPGGIQCSFLNKDTGSLARITFEPDGLSETSFRLHPPAQEVARSMRGEERRMQRINPYNLFQ